MATNYTWTTVESVDVKVVAPGEVTDAFGQANDTVALVIGGLVIEARRAADLLGFVHRVLEATPGCGDLSRALGAIREWDDEEFLLAFGFEREEES